MFKIQSINDLVTNSSSEVFIIHSPAGLKQIQEAVKSIFRVLIPDKNPDDYIDVSLEFTDNDWEDSFNEYLQESLLPQYENLTNEEFLLKFPDEYINSKLEYIQNQINDGEGAPCAEYCIKGLNPEGRIIAKAIDDIINSVDFESRYC